MRRVVARLLPPVLVVLLAFFLRVHLLPSVPFGWHPDEASKGLLARDVLAGKDHPVFFSAFTGRDALYVYLEAGAFALFGEGILAGRLLSAFIGVLTVALTVALGKRLFGRRAGLLAAALLAVSLWHVIASRNGYRAVVQPVVQLAALWCFLHGWRAAGGRPPRGWALAAGFFLGLTQYTYPAARVFPVLFVSLVALLLSEVRLPHAWQIVVKTFLVAAAVVLPLVIYFIQHPMDFYGRAAQISVFTPAWSGGNPWIRLWQSVKETALMFTVWGDPNYRFNIAGRPVFGFCDGVLFYLGLALCFWRAVRKRGWQRMACATTLLWIGLMLLPMVFSAEGLPYYQRAIGALPAIYFAPALALDALASKAVGLATRRRQAARLVCALGIVSWIAFLAARAYRDYFQVWHTALRNDDDRRVGMVYVADYFKQSALEGEVYLSTEYAQHPTLAFLAPERYDGIHWFDARQCLPLPPPGVEATYVFLVENAPQPALLARAPDLQRVYTGLDRFGRPVFEVYRWPGGAHPAPVDRSPAIWSWEVTFLPGDPGGLRHEIELPVNLGGVMEFVGHERSANEVTPEGVLELVLYWRLLQRPDRSLSMFAHLLDAQSQIVAEYDANRYNTAFWREDGGEMLLSYFPLVVKPGTPPGEYQLEIGVYHLTDDGQFERLPVYERGEMVADRLLLKPVLVR